MGCDQYELSCYRKPANFASNLPLFHSNWMNISLIANLNVCGERAPNTAHSTYCSCYHTIRTQILNWSQSCRNSEVKTAVQYEPGPKSLVGCPVQVATRQDKAGQVLGRVWYRTELIFPFTPGPLAGDPYLLLTLVVDQKMRSGMKMEMIWRIWIWEIRGRTGLIRFGRPCIGVITHWIGSTSCPIRNDILTCIQNSFKSLFLKMISNLLPSHSFSSSTLPSPKHMKLSHPSLSLHAMIIF